MQFSILAKRQKCKRFFLFRFFNVSSYVGSFSVSLLFLARKKSTSSFLASKLRAESFLLRFLGFIKRLKIVENVYDLCQPSMFSTKPGSIFPAHGQSRVGLSRLRWAPFEHFFESGALSCILSTLKHFFALWATFEQYFTFRANFEQHLSSKTF